MSAGHKTRLLAAVELLEAATPDEPQDHLGFAAYRELDAHLAAAAEHLVGHDPGRAAVMLGRCGISQRRRAELAEAEATQTRALTIKETAYGPDHSEVAITLTNLGIIQQQLGRLDEAIQATERALAIFTAAYGPNHPHTQQAQRNLDLLHSR